MSMERWGGTDKSFFGPETTVINKDMSETQHAHVSLCKQEVKLCGRHTHFQKTQARITSLFTEGFRSYVSRKLKKKSRNLTNHNLNELDMTNIYCGASFILPDKLKVVWKYAKNMNVTDLSYFKDIHTGEDLFVLLKPTRVSHKGTYACEIFDEDDDIIIRKFYYLLLLDQMQMEFHWASVEKLPAQEDEEERLQHGPSITETILSYLKSPISYAIYAGVCLLVIVLVIGYLAR
ncbi:uncharacterized protein LOC142219175 [Leptodactylus fuscus]|uniref:uncharacterized protein LOC142219175 n=1 Tax=Leptodactylus fuscus TaxID=238119 RepID=UPI003F4EBF65